VVGAGHDEVDVPDRRRGQRPALVQTAAAIAVVRALNSVIDAPATRAAAPTPAQLAVERVQNLGVELADLQVTEARRDVVADVAAVEPSVFGDPANCSRYRSRS
jgi:hypothetical protein